MKGRQGTIVIALGAALILLAPYLALYEVYGVVLPGMRADASARADLKKRVAKQNTDACSAIREVESALGDFASYWLPPDQDYLRTHPHENSALAAFHANRVQGLSDLKNRMTIAQRKACTDSAQ